MESVAAGNVSQGPNSFCKRTTNLLMPKGLVLTPFAEKPFRNKESGQTTNLGVGSSNLSGRAI
jgi:hypothetical protein